MKAVCSNKWCKGHFEKDVESVETMCPKCKSFDQNLSGGVTWEEKEYSGDRFDGKAHEISITNYKNFGSK